MPILPNNCMTELGDSTRQPSSLNELKRFTDTLHNEILLLEGKDEDDKEKVEEMNV